MRVNIDPTTLLVAGAVAYVAWRLVQGGEDNKTQRAALDAYGSSSLETPFNWWMGTLIDWSNPEAQQAGRPADETADDVAANLQRRFENGGLPAL